jgi:hypothetical protein
MSTSLGSDATFFLGDTGTAYCTGRGEVVTPLPPLPHQTLYVVKPLVRREKKIGRGLAAVSWSSLLSKIIKGRE